MSGKAKSESGKSAITDAEIYNDFVYAAKFRGVHDAIKTILQKSLKKYPSPKINKIGIDEVTFILELFFGPGANDDYVDEKIRARDLGLFLMDARCALIDALPKIQKKLVALENNPKFQIKLCFWRAVYRRKMRRQGFTVANQKDDDLPDIMWKESAKHLAARFEKMGFSVTERTIDHIRSELASEDVAQKVLKIGKLGK